VEAAPSFRVPSPGHKKPLPLDGGGFAFGAVALPLCDRGLGLGC
jgi:hypothetical protein